MTRRVDRVEHHLQDGDVERLGSVVISEDELRRTVTDLGEQITRDYQGKSPLLVAVLKGASIFMADLARAIRLPVEFDFMAVASYGSATKTSGVVRIVKDLDIDLTDRHVVVVEDIVDSGLTLSFLRKNLLARNPASLEVCALVVKKGLQRDDPNLRYVGFYVAPDFLVGYGLDVAERFRNLPYMCTYREEGDELASRASGVSAGPRLSRASVGGGSISGKQEEGMEPSGSTPSGG